jgi:mitochondrial intermembrane space import and assembly protein 40
LEEEASQQGAFNEETGEINWDCPCLGGMAHGPCGEQFKAAFSCFVFSKEEPKGVDCIEHFKTMQNCFREHPDVYGAELEDEGAPPPEGVEGEVAPAPTAAQAEGAKPQPSQEPSATPRERAQAATQQVKQDHEPVSESDAVVPKAAHDAR